jgi:hypothetical protein
MMDLLAVKLTQQTAGSRIRTAKSENAISLDGFFMDEPSLLREHGGPRKRQRGGLRNVPLSEQQRK